MPTLVMSSKGQLVLPAALRRKMGMGAGAHIEVVEEADGIKLRVLRPVEATDVTLLAGLIKASSKGRPRRLEDFDPAILLARSSKACP